MSNKIIGLLIDPEARTITEVEVNRNSHNDCCLDHMRELIGCRYVEVGRDGLHHLPGDPADDIWFDDEARLFTEKLHTWQLPLWNPIIGRGLVLGYDDRDGSSVSHTLSAEAIDVLRDTIVWSERNE